jgi:hypothetical protein
MHTATQERADVAVRGRPPAVRSPSAQPVCRADGGSRGPGGRSSVLTVPGDSR